MKKIVSLKIIIILQSLMLAGCVCYGGWLFYENLCLKIKAEMLASDVGFEDARIEFVHGHHWLYEIKFFKLGNEGKVLDEDFLESTGRMEGPFEVKAVLTGEDYPSVFGKIQQAKIDSHNHNMHRLYEHPELFDACGFPLLNTKKNQKSAASPK